MTQLDINITESKGMRRVEGLGISNDQFLSPLKVKKANIGSPKNPKFSNIRDYWDDKTVGKVTYLLHEFQHMFPRKLSKMKGIIRDMGEMKIPLRSDVKSVKDGPYRLNSRYKEKVKVEMNQMLDTIL